MRAKIRSIILGILLALVLCFIFGNSFQTQEESAQESETIYETVKPALDETFGKDKVTHHIFRKSAHFLEYFLLGLTTLMFVYSLGLKLWIRHIIAYPFGFMISLIDELIVQKMSGRGSQFSDSLLDFSGFLTAAILFLVFFYLISFIITKIKLNKLNENH